MNEWYNNYLGIDGFSGTLDVSMWSTTGNTYDDRYTTRYYVDNMDEPIYVRWTDPRPVVKIALWSEQERRLSKQAADEKFFNEWMHKNDK